MKTLKDKLDDYQFCDEIRYIKEDVREAVEEFEKELGPLVNINKYAYLSIKKRFREIFGDWED